ATNNKTINNIERRIVLRNRSAPTNTNSYFRTWLPVCSSYIHPWKSSREHISCTGHGNFSDFRTVHSCYRSSHIRLFYFSISVIDQYNLIQLIDIYLQYNIDASLVTHNNLFGGISNIRKYQNGF